MRYLLLPEAKRAAFLFDSSHMVYKTGTLLRVPVFVLILFCFGFFGFAFTFIDYTIRLVVNCFNLSQQIVVIQKEILLRLRPETNKGNDLIDCYRCCSF